jgi:hypothetical protein
MAKQKSAKSGDKKSKGDVISLFSAEHRKIKKLFREFENLSDINEDPKDQERNSKKAKIVTQLCTELIIHAQAEEALFYPAVREAIAGHEDIKEEELMDEIAIEQAGVRAYLGQLVRMSPSDSYYDARVRVLRKYTQQHARELKGKVFPMIKKTGLDIQGLGEQISKLKDELKARKSPQRRPRKKLTLQKNNTS